MQSFLRKHYFTIAISFVILLALLLRCLQAKVGLPYIYNFDEPATASTALRIMKTGDYNPHFFGYGSLMIYLNLFVDNLYYLFHSVFSTGKNSYLNSPQDIIIEYDTGWHWTISHPMFYFWDRILISILGVATVGVVFLIGKELFNKWVGLVSAAFLATLPFHITHSGFITPDVPVTFFFVSVVFFSILYIQKGKKLFFILSLIFSGLAIATKLNAGLVILMPVFSLLWCLYERKTIVKKTDWLLIALIPSIVFILVMPYAILDLPYFIRDVVGIYLHYNSGHEGSTSNTWLEHCLYQMHEIKNNVGFLASVFIVVGLLGVFNKRLLAVCMIVPIIYALYMFSMKVNVHRNFLILYPFFALLIGASFYYIYHGMNYISRKFNFYNIKSVPILITLFAVSFLSIQANPSIQNGVRSYHLKDTRSEVVEFVNTLKGVRHVLVAKELRVHANDLDRLNFPFSVQPLEFMASDAHPVGTIYLMPSKILPYTLDRLGFNTVLEATSKQSIIDMVRNEDVIKDIEGQATVYDLHSIKPGILIVNRMPSKPLGPSFISFDVCELDSNEPVKIDYSRTMSLNGGYIKTPEYWLLAGDYSLRLHVGNMASGKSVTRKVSFNNVQLNLNLKIDSFGTKEKVRLQIYGDGKVIAEKLLMVGKEMEPIELAFILAKPESISARIEHIIDYNGEHSSVPILIENIMIKSFSP